MSFGTDDTKKRSGGLADWLANQAPPSMPKDSQAGMAAMQQAVPGIEGLVSPQSKPSPSLVGQQQPPQAPVPSAQPSQPQQPGMSAMQQLAGMAPQGQPPQLVPGQNVPPIPQPQPGMSSNVPGIAQTVGQASIGAIERNKDLQEQLMLKQMNDTGAQALQSADVQGAVPGMLQSAQQVAGQNPQGDFGIKPEEQSKTIDKLKASDPRITGNPEHDLNTITTDIETPLSQQNPYARKSCTGLENQYRASNPVVDNKNLPCSADDGSTFHCPFSGTKCSRPSFWERMKGFFRHLFGVDNADQFKQNIQTQNLKDPVALQSSLEEMKGRGQSQPGQLQMPDMSALQPIQEPLQKRLADIRGTEYTPNPLQL
jgi:hypothetical protein